MQKIDQIKTLHIGVQAENKAREICIDVGAWLEKWPSARFEIAARRPTEKTPYIAVTTLEGTTLKWSVRAADVGIPGIGRCDVRAYAGDVVAKTRIMTTIIEETLEGTPSETPPDAAKDWVDKVTQAADSIKELQVEAETLVPGSEATAEYDAQTGKMKLGIPRGRNGRDGAGTGDMAKETYDANENGVVDDAEKLGGQLPAYYAKASDLNGLKYAGADEAGGAAKDAEKLGGQLPAYYAKASDLNGLKYAGADEAGGAAKDAEKLGGQLPAYYAKASDLSGLKYAGADEAGGAAKNAEKLGGQLPAYYMPDAETATATAAGWTESAPYTQTISITGMTADANAVVGLSSSTTADMREAARKALIVCTAQANGSITLTADGEKPAVDLAIAVMMWRAAT